MSGIIFGVIGIAFTLLIQTAGFSYWMGRQSQRLDTAERDLAAERAAREQADRDERAAREQADAANKSESHTSIINGDASRDRRIEKIETKIDRLETDLSDKMDMAVAKIEGIVSGFSVKLGELAGDVRVMKETKQSVARMPAVRDSRGE